MIRKGDKIKCLRDGNAYGEDIHHGLIYRAVSNELAGCVQVRTGGYWWGSVRFEKVEENMNLKTVTLNGVEYEVENIPGKGECLVPVKRKPKVGEVWTGPAGGTYIVTASDETQGFELRSKMVYPIPPSAQYVAPSITVWFKNGGSV